MISCKNILYPINLNSKNHDPLAVALKMARSNKSRIHFLYVNDEQAGIRHPTDREDAVALKVKEVAQPELLEGLDIVYATDKGDLSEIVAEYCKKNGIDMIIAGHKHRGKLAAALFDSEEESLINAVNVPILLIPKP